MREQLLDEWRLGGQVDGDEGRGDDRVLRPFYFGLKNVVLREMESDAKRIAIPEFFSENA